MSRESVEILAELCDAIGVSGFEDEVRSIIERRIASHADEIRTDALGNLIALRHARDPDAPTLMIDAHMDEIGLVVSYIEPAGFLRFAPIGGWDCRVLPGQAVAVRTRDGRRLRGVIGVPPPHIQPDDDRKRAYPAESLFIDVGAQSREEAAGFGIRAGDCAVPFHPFSELPNGAVLGKALDDRAGCAVLVCALQELAALPRPEMNVAAVFSTFEEVGARGAAVAAFQMEPRIALVLEGTTAGDFPGIPDSRCPCAQGRGPAITIVDKLTHCAPEIVGMLEAIAERDGIPFQMKMPLFGGTDAARIGIARSGVRTGILSVPCRYIHSPVGTLMINDLDDAVRLTVAFVRKCHELAR